MVLVFDVTSKRSFQNLEKWTDEASTMGFLKWGLWGTGRRSHGIGLRNLPGSLGDLVDSQVLQSEQAATTCDILARSYNEH